MIYKINDSEHFHLELLININESVESIDFSVFFKNKMTNKNKRHHYLSHEFNKALRQYRDYEDMFFNTKDSCTDPRRFFVKTPAGLLRVLAKTNNDDPSDYPGVYIDLITPGIPEDEELLACVEFDSCGNNVQTCVYQPEIDEPVSVIKHTIGEEREQ